jgi:ornithine cyclodeaminase/alanine dehydrogenase-like protein (mu-crystallin family)
MREADDDRLKRARIFVDSYDTTVGHIGEIKIPLEAGTIAREDLVAEFYEA